MCMLGNRGYHLITKLLARRSACVLLIVFVAFSGILTLSSVYGAPTHAQTMSGIIQAVSIHNGVSVTCRNMAHGHYGVPFH